jgi:hypothetical protein
MIRINWSEVEATREQLLRDGATKSFEMVVIVFYHSKSECDKIQVRLGQLEESLFTIANNNDVKGVYLYDVEMKKPYLKCEEQERANALERVPSSGHPNVLLEFNQMHPEGRGVWVDITIVSLQYYMQED